MNVEEKCGCGATIEIDEPTMQNPGADIRNVLADFRVAHQCPHRGSGSEASGMSMSAHAIPVPASGPPTPAPF